MFSGDCDHWLMEVNRELSKFCDSKRNLGKDDGLQ